MKSTGKISLLKEMKIINEMEDDRDVQDDSVDKDRIVKDEGKKTKAQAQENEETGIMSGRGGRGDEETTRTRRRRKQVQEDEEVVDESTSKRQARRRRKRKQESNRPSIPYHKHRVETLELGLYQAMNAPTNQTNTAEPLERRTGYRDHRFRFETPYG